MSPPGVRPHSSTVSEPPELSDVTLWTMSSAGRRVPSCGPVKILFFSAYTSLPPWGLSADALARLGWRASDRGRPLLVATRLRLAGRTSLLQRVHDHQVLMPYNLGSPSHRRGTRVVLPRFRPGGWPSALILLLQWLPVGG